MERAPTDQQAERKEGGLEKLPELELRQVMRSRRSLTKEGDMKKEILQIVPWNNYSILLRKDDPDIRIYDEDGELVPNFFGSREMIINWNLLKVALGNVSIITKERSSFRDVKSKWIGDLPAIIQRIVCQEFSNFTEFDFADKKNPSYQLSNVSVHSKGKYVILSDFTGKLFAFLTESSGGVPLEPHNWTRIDPGTCFSKTSPDLEALIKDLPLSLQTAKDVGQYRVLTTDIGLVVTEKSGNKTVFIDRIPVAENIVQDPTNPALIYYCSSRGGKIMRLDTSGNPEAWFSTTASFSKNYEEIRGLQLDPGGNFFLFYSKGDLVVVTKDTLEEVKHLPKLTHVNFNNQGNILAIDESGNLIVFEPNFAKLLQEMDRRRVAKLSEGIQLKDIFAPGVEKGHPQTLENLAQHLQPLRDRYAEEFKKIIAGVATEEGVLELRLGFVKLKNVLAGQGLRPEEVDFVTGGIPELITAKDSEFAEKIAREELSHLHTLLGQGLSLSALVEARGRLEKLRERETLLADALRSEVRQVIVEAESKFLEFFRTRGAEVVKEAEGVISRTRTELEGFTIKHQMDDWLEFRFPQLKSRLGMIARDVPLEAGETYQAIIASRTALQELADSYEQKFKQAYAAIREKAAGRTQAVLETLAFDIEGLLERVRAKRFSDRTAAEQYFSSSEARKALEGEIEALRAMNPDAAKELSRALKVRTSQLFVEIEQGSLAKVAETGQQMALFGKTLFPKWEARVRKKSERAFDISFAEDPKSHGPGIKAGQILGDVVVMIKDSFGESQKVRLYEGWDNENEWQLGVPSYRGEAIPPCYMSAEEFRGMKKGFADWEKGAHSKLRREFEEKRETLKNIYKKRTKAGARKKGEPAFSQGEQFESWKEEYSAALKEFSDFVAQHHIVLLQRIDKIKTEPEIETSNGKGFVPEWQSHWVVDPQTEKDLEEMARMFKMQLDLQEGILNLKGHAGTGKDVRMKMFAARTNRPYFGIDGTKWTTEFELSEDVVLESKDGASVTVRVPSNVLNGITTPGAIVYFNEFNAMPEQAQIFLHALMDEKRSITLKTSSGKVVRAHPSVLLASSMNPDYPGTFKPQFATRSRMVSLEIGYPPLTRVRGEGDNNPNPPLDASEALRMARGIDSLEELTYEANLSRNEFVKVWDKYVNGIANDALEPSLVQKFDLDVILAAVQFAGKLREEFIKIFEKSREARNALPVNQPLTGRELRRIAYNLKEISAEEKATANPEAVARNLLEEFFLTHIDSQEDRDKIKTAMATWTSQKRVKA